MLRKFVNRLNLIDGDESDVILTDNSIVESLKDYFSFLNIKDGTRKKELQLLFESLLCATIKNVTFRGFKSRMDINCQQSYYNAKSKRDFLDNVKGLILK